MIKLEPKSMTAADAPTIGGVVSPGAHSIPTAQGIYDLPLADDDHEFLAQCRRLLFNTLLALDARPQLREPGRRMGTAKKGERREIWEPTIVGRGYRIARGVGGERGSHASPRPHWRRGHFRRQAFGPRTQPEHRTIWIEPTLVGIGRAEDE